METVLAPSPFQKARVRFLPVNPSQTKSPSTILLIFMIFILNILSTTSIAAQFPRVPYSKYCNDFVPESPSTNTKVSDYAPVQLSNAFFSGGDKILGQQNPQFDADSRKSVSLRTRHVYRTEAFGVFKLEGVVTLKGSKISKVPGNLTRRGLRLVNYRPPRIPVRRKEAVFVLSGLWSAASGKLCMVGSGLSYLRYVNVVLKLNYPNCTTIITSLVNGTMQSLESESSLTYFEPISILGVSPMGYNYTMIDRENKKGGFSAYDSMENVSRGIHPGRKICSVIRSAGRVELEYTNDCGAVNCNPLGSFTKNLPVFMIFNEVEDCKEDGRVRYLLEFSNSSYGGFQSPFDPNTTLLAEGGWDEEKKRLDLVACRIFNTTHSLSDGWVGDCSIRLSLRLPATFTLRNRSTIVGQMWSNKSSNDSSYFARIPFHSTGNKNPKLGDVLRYEYTEIENMKKHCAKGMAVKGKGGKYPSGYSPDMRFDMMVRNRKGKITWGYSSPLSVGDRFYELFPMFARHLNSSAAEVNPSNSNSNVFNVSYVMSFTQHSGFKLGGGFSSAKSVEISAEGIYDAKNGVLCMVGCRQNLAFEKLPQNYSLDCEILVNVQYPPLRKAGGTVKGTIKSTRNKTDPLYFERLEFSSSSIYTSQAQESIWRMDLEITMVLVSNTLACFFVGLQLLHVKKQPDALPFISVVMLIVLTLAHMIPLLLNFEAMFLSNHYRQNVFLGRDGWLEVNEVLVRVITMIAFLLQFRLLQLTWSARNSDGSHKTLWVSDKKVLYLSVPLYILGGLIAWFVHLWSKSSHITLLQQSRFGYKQQSLWGDLKSYAGLVLDGFLLPQIIFNLFCDSKDTVLAPSYYIGTTFIRLLPHAYDLYRAHSSTTTWPFNYIYANPRMDYYSTAWDIIISCGGLLFVSLIFLQQKFGGRCFLPKRFSSSTSTSVYEKVPVVSTE